MAVDTHVINKVQDTVLNLYKINQKSLDEFIMLKYAKKERIVGDTIKIPVIDFKNENVGSLTVLEGEAAKKITQNNTYVTEVATMKAAYMQVTKERMLNDADNALKEATASLMYTIGKENEDAAFEAVYKAQSAANKYVDLGIFNITGYTLAENNLKDGPGENLVFVHPTVYADIVGDINILKHFDVQKGDMNKIMGNTIVRSKRVKKTATAYENFIIKTGALLYFADLEPEIEVDYLAKTRTWDIVVNTRFNVVLPDKRQVAFYHTTIPVETPVE